MAPTFERSELTRRLISEFSRMSIGESVSFDEMSRRTGFDVDAKASYSARQIAEKEQKVFVYLDSELGFVRGSGSAMVATGAGFFKAIKRKAIKCGRRMELALTQNLSRDEHLVASETLSRSNIIASTSSTVTVRSNRERPPEKNAAPAFDTRAALAKVK